MRRSILLAALLGVRALCPVMAQEAVALSADEINATLSTKRFTVQEGSRSLRVRFSDDSGLFGLEGDVPESGRWSIKDGKLCIKWARWQGSGCGSLVRVEGQLRHLAADGQVHWIFK